MNRLKVLLAFVLATAGLSIPALTIASPAAAEPIPPIAGGGDVSLRFGDFRYPGSQCYTHRGYLDVYANDDYAYDYFTATFDMTVARDGQWVDGWYDTKEWSDTYSLDALLCRGVDPTGTYIVSGTVTFEGTYEAYDSYCDCYYDEYYSEDVFISDSFVVRAPHTASIAISTEKYRAHGWKVNGQVRYDGRAWGGKRVYFQRKASGSWRTITSKVTTSQGRVSFAFTPPRGTAKPYRLYTRAGAGVSAKASKTIYLRRR